MAEVYMTFFEHIEELRNRVRTSLVVFILGFVLGLLFSDKIITWMWNDFAGHYNLGTYQPVLTATSVMSGFMVQLDISFILGVTLAIPVLIYELFLFIEPALLESHKMLTLKVMVSSAVLFILGALFVYYIMLPLMIDFFVQSNVALGIANFFSVESFFEFELVNLFIGGMTFQTPLIIIGLNRMGVLPKAWMTKSRRMVFVVILAISGIVTPDHSIISQLALGLVMQGLFELGLLFCTK